MTDLDAIRARHIEPTTEAGRAFLATDNETDPMAMARYLGRTESGWDTWEAIAAIEAEAVTAALTALRAEVVALRPPDRFVALDGTWDQGFSESAVLAIIDAALATEAE